MRSNGFQWHPLNLQSEIGTHRATGDHLYSCTPKEWRAESVQSEGSPASVIQCRGGGFAICIAPLRLVWVCNAIDDGLKFQYLFGGDLSSENLIGSRSGGGKGTLDLLMYKQSVLEYMTNLLVTKHRFGPVECVDKFKKTLACHDSYRRDFREASDKSWWGKFPGSLKGLFSLVEELVYSAGFDGTLKTAVKWKKGAEDLMEYERVKDRLSDILDSLGLGV